MIQFFFVIFVFFLKIKIQYSTLKPMEACFHQMIDRCFSSRSFKVYKTFLLRILSLYLRIQLNFYVQPQENKKSELRDINSKLCDKKSQSPFLFCRESRLP